MYGVAMLTAVALLLTGFAPSSAFLPGFKLRLSKKGLDYANVVAHQQLTKALIALKIPNQGGHDGHLDWSLTNIENRGVVVPSSSLAFVPSVNGLSWTMSNLGVALHSNWRVKYKKGWVKASTSGSIDLNIRKVSLSVTVHLAVQAGGRPSLTVAACQASIGNVEIHFHGGTAWILNLFRGLIEDKVKKMMQEQICQVVGKEVNVDANEKLKQLKVSVEVDNRFLVDYSLVSAPAIHTNDLETQHKGEVFWKTDKKEAPFNPTTIPALADESHMMYLWITEYIAKTFALTAQNHKFLEYNITDKDFPPHNATFLNTTCHVMCIGKLIPQIGKKFPNAKMEARVKSLVTPELSISSKGIYVTGNVMAEMWAQTSNKSEYYVITLGVKFSFIIKGSVEKERLTGKIIGHKVDITVIKSAIGKINSNVVNFLTNAALNVAVIPKLNALMADGFELPVTGAVSFNNTQLLLLNHCALIATDIQAQSLQHPPQHSQQHPPQLLPQPTKDNSLKFASEIKH